MTVVRTGALGMIETRGLLGAIEAADEALKSASVSLDTLTRRQIRDANKRELVARLGMFFERSGEENRALAWEKVGKLLQKNGVMRRDAD